MYSSCLTVICRGESPDIRVRVAVRSPPVSLGLMTLNVSLWSPASPLAGLTCSQTSSSSEVSTFDVHACEAWKDSWLSAPYCASSTTLAPSGKSTDRPGVSSEQEYTNNNPNNRDQRKVLFFITFS